MKKAKAIRNIVKLLLRKMRKSIVISIVYIIGLSAYLYTHRSYYIGIAMVIVLTLVIMKQRKKGVVDESFNCRTK